jgi:hypothetical protein
MKNLLLFTIVILMMAASACKNQILTNESAQDVLRKELPVSIWLTTTYPMKVKGAYTSPVMTGLLQPINHYDNATFYKLTNNGWPLVVRFKEGELQGYEEAEVYTHYIEGYKVTDFEQDGADEVTAAVEVVYVVTGFIGGSPGKKNATSDGEIEICYDAVYTKTIRVKLRRYNDGWHVDNDKKPAVVKSLQSADSLVRDPANTFKKACLTLPRVQIKSFLVYDDDGSLSNFDPLKEDNFNGIKPHGNAKVVIIGNLRNVSFTITNVDAKDDDSIILNKHFDLKDSVEFVFPGYCDRLRLDLKSDNGSTLFQDYMNYSCGG